MGSREPSRRIVARIAPWTLALAVAFAPACDGGDGGDPGNSGDADVAVEAEIVAEVVPQIPTPAELAAGLDQALWWEDLQFIAQPREPGSAHWQAVQDLCTQRFEDLGYAVSLHEYATGVNVIGIKKRQAGFNFNIRHQGHQSGIFQAHRLPPGRLSENFDLRTVAALKPFRQNDIPIFQIGKRGFERIQRRCLNNSDPLGRNRHHRICSGCLVPPGIFTRLIHFKSVVGMFHRANRIALLFQARYQLFNQGGFTRI